MYIYIEYFYTNGGKWFWETDLEKEKRDLWEKGPLLFSKDIF